MKEDNDKLVTLAIHTFEKAQILKTMLESEGVEVVLNNVNQIQPVVSAGVRVRIKEVDLTKALRILEDNKWGINEDHDDEQNESDYVLVPVDFSEYSMKVCELGFTFASRRNLSVTIMHVQGLPFYPTPLSIGDATSFQVAAEYSVKEEYERAMSQMTELKNKLHERMSKGELPEVQFTTIIRDGAPEDAILSFSKRHPPVIIVMGTRGKSKKDSDLIGSVAAEVIDSSKVPVLVIPEEVPFNDLRQAKEVAVATSFDQRDLILFDSYIKLCGDHLDPHMHIFNISTYSPEWNDVQLKAIHEYYRQHYPNRNITYNALDQGDFSLALEKFIRQENIEMIVVNTYKRNIFAKFFNPSMARRMLFHAGTPLLVMHGKNS